MMFCFTWLAGIGNSPMHLSAPALLAGVNPD
jgi:hypothetical protein